MRPDCDLAIAGAGFAGLACARAARARGLKVVVLDRKADPGSAVHTTGILVQEAVDIWDVPPGLLRPIPKVRLYAPNLRAIDLESPGYRFYASDTPALLRWHAETARKAGAELRQGTPFAAGRREGHHVVIETNRGRPLRARWLVGADGARSTVAQTFGLGVNTHWLVGMEAEYDGVEGVAPEFLHTFLDRRIAPGYIAWVVPGTGGITQVGLACRRPDKPALDDFVARVSGLFDFSRARVVARRSGPIPVGGLVRPVSCPGVVLTGDAAGIVSPLTAGGIYTALEFGALAGEAVADHLADAGPEPGALLAAAYPRFRVKSVLRRIADLGVPNPILNLLLDAPPFRRFAQIVYFHNEGLWSRAAWRDLLRREVRGA